MTTQANSEIQLGISTTTPCSYLDAKQEQLLFVLDERVMNDWGYEQLIGQGFRRSGDDIYRPHCASCSACQPLRIPINLFTPSKSQRRLLNKGKTIEWKLNFEPSIQHYPLYARYIHARHSSGSMFPPSEQHYQQFTQASWLPQLYLEGWLNQQLICVAVTDLMPSSLSALYTFYEPELEHLSLGTLAVLQQIKICRTLKKPHLYLGYQIEQCPAMNYKSRFKPYEKFIENSWILSEK